MLRSPQPIDPQPASKFPDNLEFCLSKPMPRNPLYGNSLLFQVSTCRSAFHTARPRATRGCVSRSSLTVQLGVNNLRTLWAGLYRREAPSLQTATRSAWIRRGIQWWIVFGTGFGMLAAFQPALTFLPVSEAMPTIIGMVFASALTGTLHGLMVFAKFKNSYAEELPVTRMAVLLWGFILGVALYGGLFDLLPSMEHEGGEVTTTVYVVIDSGLRSFWTRCGIGAVVGLLASGMMVGRTHPA